MTSTLKRFVKRLIYIGNRRMCNICRHSFRKFVPGGVEKRPEAICPNCSCEERHRFFFYYFEQSQKIEDLRGKKMLHFAPEHGLSRRLQEILGKGYISADLYSSAAMDRVDICDLPYENESFDYIIAFHVLEHVLNDIGALVELRRVLKKSGTIYLMVPIADRDSTYEDPNITQPEDRLKAFGQEDHVRIYGRDFTQRINPANLTYRAITVRDVEQNESVIEKYKMDNETLYVLSTIWETEPE